MPKFLFCSTVLNRKQYTVLNYQESDNLVEKLDYLLTHRIDAVIWPLFVKSDIKECLPMDRSLPSLLRGVIVGSDTCKIRYNGNVYQVDEITKSQTLKRYWHVQTDCGDYLLDPQNIEFILGSSAPKAGSF
jgi:hypothetical protein